MEFNNFVPKALVVGLGRWGEIMTKCLIEYGYNVYYANRDLSKSRDFENSINSDRLFSFKEYKEQGIFNLILICVKPKDIFEAWLKFRKYSKCILIEKPGPLSEYEIKKIFQVSNKNKITTLVNYEFFFMNLFFLKKLFSQQKKFLKKIEVVWTKELNIKGDLIWRIFPHMIAELFLFESDHLEFKNMVLNDSNFNFDGLIENIPFKIEFRDDKNKSHFTNFIMNDGSYFLKEENIIYHNNKVIKNLNQTTIENMLYIINYGKPADKFVKLNQDLSLFINRIINNVKN